MGISTGGSKNGPKSDINVTPLVDIVLVLLIIFLVVTPVLMRHINLEVPRKLEDHEHTDPGQQVTLLVRADSTVKLSDGREDIELTNRFELAARLRPILEKKRGEKVVFVDFEDPVLYGEAVSTMDTVKAAGADKVALKIREGGQQPVQ